MKKILILLTVLFPAMLFSQVNLEYKLKKGNVYRYRSETSYDSKQEMMGQEMKISGKTNSLTRMDINDVSPGGIMSVIYTMEEMTIQTKGGGMDTTMTQKELIGKRTKIDFDKYGNILDKGSLDSVKLAGETFGMDFGSESAGRLFKLPGKPLKEGESWNYVSNDTTKVGGGSTITKTTMDYTLGGPETKMKHNCLKINFKGKIELTGKMNQSGMDMFLEGTGDVTGTLWFDVQLGLLVYQESNTINDMTIAMTGQMQMTIPSTQNMKSVNQLVE